MIKKQINENDALQMLREFDELGSIQPSPGWEEALMRKLHSHGKGTSGRSIQQTIYAGMLIFILVNITLFVRVTTGNSGRPDLRNEALQGISREFMINPTDKNN